MSGSASWALKFSFSLQVADYTQVPYIFHIKKCDLALFLFPHFQNLVYTEANWFLSPGQSWEITI